MGLNGRYPQMALRCMMAAGGLGGAFLTPPIQRGMQGAFLASGRVVTALKVVSTVPSRDDDRRQNEAGGTVNIG